jgi:hypothetical protein
MNKQYGNYIEIVPLYGVTSVDGNTITLKSGYSMDQINTLNDISPSEEPEKSPAGTLYKFNLTAGIEKLSGTLKERYGANPPVILKIFTAEGNETAVVGSVQNPVRITWTPSPEYDEIALSRSSIFAVL